MKIILEYQGKRYQSAETDEFTAAVACEKLYQDLSRMDKIKMNLEDGSFLIAGKDVVQNGVLIFVP